LQRFAGQRKPASAAAIIAAAGFSAPAQQQNLMIPCSQWPRFSGGRRDPSQRSRRAASGKFLLFTEV
jgi:hypothetical protein